MKSKARFFTLLLALLFVFSAGMAVSAATVPESGSEAPAITETESPVFDSDAGGAENPGADISNLQGEEPSGPEAPDEAAPAPKKSSNTPFFVGAGIAVLIFAGVAVYCKTNGNKTL